MAGLVPAIHELNCRRPVDARNKYGHDELGVGANRKACATIAGSPRMIRARSFAGEFTSWNFGTYGTTGTAVSSYCLLDNSPAIL